MTITEHIAAVRREMAEAARESGRSERDIILVGASKMNDAAACQEAIAAGVDALGENRVQEMTAKLAQNAYDGAPLHFIGHLQRNKVRQVVGKAALIQSIGSEALLREVEKEAARQQLVQDILLEVNIGQEESKGGCMPQEAEALARQAMDMGAVRLRGLMAIPPVSAQPGANRPYFAAMRQLFIDIRQKMSDNENDIICLSMGMSGDFEDAIAEGATMVRVGSALFGPRPPMRSRLPS